MNGQPWTAQQLEGLRRLYRDQPASAVAAAIGRSVKSVHSKAAKLKLGKSKEFWASDMSGRVLRGQHSAAMAATRFKPGSKPWNHGLSYMPGGRCQDTQFRPGTKPVNELPIGSLRVVDNKGFMQLEQKVHELPGPNARRWVAVSRLVWEARHGPLSAGRIVVFKPGLKTLERELITLDRLECITRAENARRNHPNSHNPELAKLVQLKGAITRQVNRITREQKEATP